MLLMEYNKTIINMLKIVVSNNQYSKPTYHVKTKWFYISN